MRVLEEPLRLDNETCPYCGVLLDPATATRDHVVGRRFVPKGKLDRCWNVILGACQPCNNRKSDLENDISAITMQPDPTGRFARPDPVLTAEARRKGLNSLSRRTRKPVGQSSEEITIKGSLGSGSTFSFTATAPPQLDESRVWELARFHVAGLFYTITYNESTRRGGFWPGGFFPLMMSLRGDWGNPVQLAFMRMVDPWLPRIIGSTADHYFLVAVRRHPEEELWSWAVEWNDNLRAIGFFGNEQVARRLASELPELEMHILGYHDKGVYRGRSEIALSAEDDIMFRDAPAE